MKFARILICVLLLSIYGLAISEQAPTGRSYSLVLLELGKGSYQEQTQSLVRYKFRNGVMVSKVPLAIAKTKDIRLDLGVQIYRNKYIVTDFGDIIDAASGQLIFKSEGELDRFDKDIVIIKSDNNDREEFFAYNLSSHKYQRVKDNWLLEKPSSECEDARINANGKIAVRGCNNGIWLQYANGRKKHLEGHFAIGGTPSCNSFPSPPVVWADENHILTHSSRGQLILVDLNGKTQPLLTITITDAETPACGPKLRIDRDNQIFYTAINEAWRIDVKKRSFEPYLWEPQGNEFYMEYTRNFSYGHKIRYRDEEIGRFWCDDAHTAPGYIAVAFGPVGSNLGYPEGIKVWSSENRQWTTITIDDPNFLGGIVGWLEE
jgi:hypothetical protein